MPDQLDPANRRTAMPRIARLSRHPAIPLLVIVLANIGFYAQLASAFA
jgi:hypothetical protein